MATIALTFDNLLAVAQVIAAVFTMIYSYDVLVLHRKFKALGQVLVKYAPWLTVGIFITVLSIAIDSFGKWPLYIKIIEIIGIISIGIYFRKCMHEFFSQPMHVQK